jgi:hypothetical protein
MHHAIVAISTVRFVVTTLALSWGIVPGSSVQAGIDPDQFAGLDRHGKFRFFVKRCRCAS